MEKQENAELATGALSHLSVELEAVQKATIVKVLPTKIWTEKGFDGVVRIKMQHEGCEEFDFIQIQYDHRYTSNSHQRSLTVAILRLFGVTEEKSI